MTWRWTNQKIDSPVEGHRWYTDLGPPLPNVASSRLFAPIFPSVSPALVFLSVTPHLATYVTGFSPGHFVFQHHEMMWLGAIFPNITKLVIFHSDANRTVSELVNSTSVFSSLIKLNIVCGNVPDITDAALTFPPNTKLQTMSMGGGFNTLNSVIDGCARSESCHSLINMTIACTTRVAISDWSHFTRTAEKFTMLKTLTLMLSPLKQDQHHGLEQSTSGIIHTFNMSCAAELMFPLERLSLGQHPALQTLVLQLSGDPGHKSITLIRKMFDHADLPQLVSMLISFNHLNSDRALDGIAAFCPFAEEVDHGCPIFSSTITQGLRAVEVAFQSKHDVRIDRLDDFLQLFGKARKVVALVHGQGKQVLPSLT
jgi:hypothetical protein